MTNNLAVLGSTGSVGTQALQVAQELGINVVALSANSNIALLEKQVRKFKPKIVAVHDPKFAAELSLNIKDTFTKVEPGTDGLCSVATINEADTVLNSVVGMVGLEPTLAAISNGKNVALANKETLVTGGKLVMDLAKKKKVKILPVDSEHSAIFQCLAGYKNVKEINKIILTASGGPFFGKTTEELRNVNLTEALKHPNWNMGPKITVDSATMMNKGLEIIEAVWLFGVSPQDVDVVVHRESVVHSMVEFRDRSIIAQLAVPSMKMPIQYALTYPDRVSAKVDRLDFFKIGKLSFYKPDYDTFEALDICIDAITQGESIPVVVNAANEEAVGLFLQQRISFLDIINIVKEAKKVHVKANIGSLNDVLTADKWAREFVYNLVGE